MSRSRSTVPKWYVSLRSPYSWLALDDGLNRYPDFLDACELRVFFEPDAGSREMLETSGGTFPYVPMSRAKHFYILRDVARQAGERGLRPTWPVDRDPVWEVPSLAVLAAGSGTAGPGPESSGSPSAARQLIIRLSRARFQDGLDICRPDVVASCALDCGLDPALAEAATDPRWRQAGLAALKEVDRDGVFGVPFFVIGRQPFWGLDRLPAAVAAFRSAAGTSTAAGSAPAEHTWLEPPADPGAERELIPAFSAESGHAGGCG